MTDTRQARANKGNRIAIGALIAIVSLFCFLSDIGALGGVGRMVYGFLVGFFGLASYAYALMGIIFGIAIAFGVRVRQRFARSAYLFGMLLLGVFALHIYTSSGHIIGANYGEYLLKCYHATNTAGGMLFGIAAYPLMKVVTGVGALSIACAAFLIMAGILIVPSLRRNVVYKAATPKERKKEMKNASAPRNEKRRRGDRVTPASEPVITDFAHTSDGTRLFVVDVDGKPEKPRKGKGSHGYTPIDFDPLYPNKNGGYEDEQRMARDAQYRSPAPERETYAPVKDSAREILFGSGPSDENVARYEAARRGKLEPMSDVGRTYTTPSRRRQDMMDALGGGEDPHSDFIARHRAENEDEGKSSVSQNGEVDFEALKNESLKQWQNSPAPIFEADASGAPSGGEVLRAANAADDKKELARPTRQMPKIDDKAAPAPQDKASYENVNVGMLGALNKAKEGPAGPVEEKQKETVVEAYKNPQSSTPGAELARSEGQGGYTPVQKPGLDSVRYTPSNSTKIPRAFKSSAVDQTPAKSAEPIKPVEPAKPTYQPADKLTYQPLKKVEPYQPAPIEPLEEEKPKEEAQLPSEPIKAPREVTGDKMSAAAIQSATDIAHMSAKDVESAEMDARIENIKKSKGLTPSFTDSQSMKEEKAKAAARRAAPAEGPHVHQPTLEQVIKQAEVPVKPKRPYVAPPLSLLEPPTEKLAPDDDIEEKKERLISTLMDFDIAGDVESVDVGPTFTMYRVKVTLKKGISVATILKYSKDIAMKMEVESVRIQAPIPGKNAVGIEVPNKRRRTVNISEILQSSTFNTAPDPVTFALGVDLYGNCHVARVAKMPHLLVAGTTGSGKSCCINTLIVSLLYKASPDDVRFILVDPKRVELSVYAGIPHLLMDEIICESDKAIKALAWAEKEMERRTRYFQETGYRDIAEYNSDVKNSGLEKMPLIVIIIDEFADLMATSKKSVEKSVGRIASLARAVGIHLVLATQRPSVDVVSGTIRNNIPSRVAFKVSDNGSSRTILDAVGAEDLLGLGDMLYMGPGSSDLKRIQGAFISNPEVKKVVEFVKSHNDCYFDAQAKDEIFNDKADKKPETSQKDVRSNRINTDLLDALELGIQLRETDGNSFSTSYIQRKLGFGYQKAARIVDTIKEMDYIGVSERDPKKTIVTMTREELEEFRASVEPTDEGDDEE